jgi:hypothetical protein
VFPLRRFTFLSLSTHPKEPKEKRKERKKEKGEGNPVLIVL